MFVRTVAVIVSLSLAAPSLALAAPATTAAAPSATTTAVAGPDLDAPSPPPAPAAQPAPAPGPVYGPPPPGYGPPPPGYDPWLEAHLANEWRFGEAIERGLGENIREDWNEFVNDERERARDRAKGDNDDDARPTTFDRHLYKKYKGKRNRGITMVGVGFAPLLVGGLLTYSNDEPSFMLFGLASLPLWAIGGVLWGRGQARLRRYEAARARIGHVASGKPRLHFRGAAPLVHPHTGTGGVTLGFAF
jgi:hypothetical protein